MEAAVPGAGGDDGAPSAKKKRGGGRPRGSSKKESKSEEMKRKREEEAMSVKKSLATSSILVILPDPGSFRLTTDLATEEELGTFDYLKKEARKMEPPLRNVIDIKDYYNQYDFLELHCFTSEIRELFPEVFPCGDLPPKLKRYPDEVYDRIISDHQLEPLVTTGEDGLFYNLPHANYAIATILRDLASCYPGFGENGSKLYPKVCFVKQSTLLEHLVDDSEELSIIVSSNFDIILESHSSEIFVKGYLGKERNLYDVYYDWLSILAVRYQTKIYPPVSVSNYFLEDKLNAKAMKSIVKPYLPFSFPFEGSADERNGMSWKRLAGHFKLKLQPKTQASFRHPNYDFVIRPIVSGVLDPNNEPVFLRWSPISTKWIANLVHERQEFATPQDWIQGDVLPSPFQIQPYDEDARKLQYHFIFWLNSNGAFEKMYMVPSVYTRPHGVLQKHMIVCENYPVLMREQSSTWQFFNRGITGIPKLIIDSIKNHSAVSGCVLVPKLMYSITFVESGLINSPSNLVKKPTAIRPAYSHDLFLDNHLSGTVEDASELPYVSMVAEKILAFLYHHWENYPK